MSTPSSKTLSLAAWTALWFIPLSDPSFGQDAQRDQGLREQACQKTEKGLRVKETSADPYVAKLIQRHAEVVSLFLKNGPAEVRKNHELPKQP